MSNPAIFAKTTKLQKFFRRITYSKIAFDNLQQFHFLSELLSRDMNISLSQRHPIHCMNTQPPSFHSQCPKPCNLLRQAQRGNRPSSALAHSQCLVWWHSRKFHLDLGLLLRQHCEHSLFHHLFLFILG